MQTGARGVQNCPWLAKCQAGSASADISWGGFMALFLILGLLWLAYVAFSAYIRCAHARPATQALFMQEARALAGRLKACIATEGCTCAHSRVSRTAWPCAGSTRSGRS